VSASGIGFVGGGRIVRIMLTGWRRAGCAPPDVVVSDTDAEVRKRLQGEFPWISVTGDNGAAARQHLVFFALHPPAFPAGLAGIRESPGAGGGLGSLAPKWTMGRIAEALGGFGHLARVIPNAPSIINRGFNPLCFSTELADVERSRISSLLAPLGACPEVAENTLEAYAIVAAMGPTYLWYQLYQLVDLGCEFGLSREASLAAVSAMVEGAAGTMAGAGLSPADVLDLIPVKPLAGFEPTVKQAYVETLVALHGKLRP
jgi:pyrroline-5-carboxylate reductase